VAGSSTSKPPSEPYPPDLDESEGRSDLDDGLLDAVVDGVDWANRRAPRAQIRRTELRNVRLTGAELGEAALTDVVFTDCRLDLAGLRNATLERVIFRDCRMDECDLYGARLSDVLYERCTLREATFTEVTLTRVELRGCDLSGLRGAEHLRGGRLPFHDALENAALFATALGIELVD
jgi:uncharacterized protein YjbI with pentapeptide repeats